MSPILESVLAGSGVITSSLIYLSPLPTVQKALAANQTGKAGQSLNSFVYAMMIVNGSVWILYGFVIGNWFVFLANILGIPLAIYYYSAALYFEKDFNVSIKSILTLMVGETIVFVTGAVSLISLSSHDHAQDTAAKGLMGGVATFIVLVFIASPLSTLFKVIKSKSAHSIDGRLAVASVVNATLWFTYGTFINDPIVYSPNMIGIVVGIAQLFLKRLYPSETNATHDQVITTTTSSTTNRLEEHAIEMTQSNHSEETRLL